MSTDEDLTYTSEVARYLESADWIDPDLDGPDVLHLKRIASSLDRQFADKGEVQSALASTFSKTLGALNRRRPAPPPDPMAGQMPGQTDLLSPQFQ